MALHETNLELVYAGISDERSAKRYLRALFLAEAAAELFDAREDAGLSQEELATRLETKQPSISRTERNLDGAISLGRFIDWVMACGTWPRSLALVSVESFVALARRATEAKSALHLFDNESTATVLVAGNFGHKAGPESRWVVHSACNRASRPPSGLGSDDPLLLTLNKTFLGQEFVGQEAEDALSAFEDYRLNAPSWRVCECPTR